MNENLSQTFEWKTASKVRYPNITVCNKKYFALHRLQEYNISNDMANYMTMVFDPSASLLHWGLKQADPQHKSKMVNLAAELDVILEKHNFTFVDLLDAVAVRSV